MKTIVGVSAAGNFPSFCGANYIDLLDFFERLVVRWRRPSSIMAFEREALLMDPGRPRNDEGILHQLGCIKLCK